MGVFTGYQPRKNLYKNREGSGLVSYRERNSVLHGWKSDREEAFRSDKSGQMLLQVRQELARATQRSGSHYGMHPFKIYQFPDSLRAFQVTDSYRRFKVRGATINIAGLNGIAPSAFGSDMVGPSTFNGSFSDTYGLFDATQLPPTNAAYVVGNGFGSSWNEIPIPADGHVYNIWFSLILPIAGGPWGGISSNAEVCGIAFSKASDPTTAKIALTLESFDATKMWPNMEFDDLYNYFIGSVVVDNGTLAAEFPGFPQVTISQHRATHLELAGSPYGTAFYAGAGGVGLPMRMRGTYNASYLYYVGDVVTITYADASTVNSFYQYVYDPPNASVYLPYNIPGPLIGVSPNGHSPDPWKLLSKSPSDADYHNGAYDGTKFYLRTS